MSIKTQNPRQNILPVELWQRIFTFATTIDGKDEFSTKRLAYFAMPCDDTRPAPTPTLGEQMMITKTRCRIVRVCKNWYAIGIQPLWSHLFLRYGTFTPVLEALQQNPLKLGNAVLRVSLMGSFDPHNRRSLTPQLTLIFDLLPNLRIYSGPVMVPQRMQSNCWVRATIQDYIKPPNSARLTCLWENISTLSLYLGWANINSIVSQFSPYFTFPRVENLNIITDGDPVGRSISNYWKFPSVHTISLDFPSSNLSIWMAFLKTYEVQLQTLQIAIQNFKFGSPIALRMPKLQALYLEEPAAKESLLRYINAPNVQRLGVFGIKLTRSVTVLGDVGILSPEISRTVDRFPKFNQLFLIVSSPPEPLTLIDSDNEKLKIWRRRGISVQITH